MIKKKILTGILLLSVMLLSFTGCRPVSEVSPPETEESTVKEAEAKKEGTVGENAKELGHANGSPWLNSCLIGNVSEDTPTDPKEDFHLYVNKDWILKTALPDGYVNWSAYDAAANVTMEKGIAMIKSEELSGHDAELIQGLFNLYTDMDARNEAGYEPVRETAEKILAAGNLEDVKSLLFEYDVERLLDFSVNRGISDAETYYIHVSSPLLLMGDAANYFEETEYGMILHDFYHDISVYMMGRLGMSEEDAVTCYEDAISLEMELAPYIYTDEEVMRSDYAERINNVMMLDEVAALTEGYPLREMLEALGVAYDGGYIIYNPNYVQHLDEVFTEDNVTKLKHYMLVRYLLSETEALDEETMQVEMEAYNQYFDTTGDQTTEQKAFVFIKGMLPDSLAKEYIKMYSSEENRQKVEDICYQVLDAYHEIFSENEWIAQETKDYAVQKLDAMTVNAGWPDKWQDYSGLNIEGLSYHEAIDEIEAYAGQLAVNLLGTVPDKEMWADDMCVLECNAYYDPGDNSINIIAGIMAEPFYYTDIPAEELYASLGYVIGHEISHGFDSNGAQYDLKGNLNNWWTDEDLKEFNSRVEKMDKYLDGILIMDDYYVNGSNVDSEMIADMTGLQCMLKIAEKEKDFDYEKFFEYFAEINASISLYSSELSWLQSDPHPFEYQRTNVSVQQFKEFYKAYGVTEGDGMYLAPKDRLVIW